MHCQQCPALEDELTEARAEIKRLKAALAKSQRSNPLTGLLNKRALNEKLSEALAYASRGRKTYVLFIDLDNFKDINDNYDHQVGDDVLKAIAQSLTNTVRSTDKLFHISGDEFVITAETDNVDEIAFKIKKAIAETTVKANNTELVNFGASVGFTLIEGSNIKAVLSQAEKSLQADKNKREEEGLRHKRLSK